MRRFQWELTVFTNRRVSKDTTSASEIGAARSCGLKRQVIQGYVSDSVLPGQDITEKQPLWHVIHNSACCEFLNEVVMVKWKV